MADHRGDPLWPVRQVVRDDVVVRINMPYIPQNCCRTSMGVAPADAKRCPSAMLEALQQPRHRNDELGAMILKESVSDADEEYGPKESVFDADEEYGPNASQIKAMNDLWQEFFGINGKLHREVQEKYIHGGVLLRLAVCIAMLPLNVPCFPWACYNERKKMLKWNDAMLQFVDELNEKLQPFGFFIKTQSNCIMVADGKRNIAHWFAISLTPEDSMKLQQEPHLKGVIDNCGAIEHCINERELCMHPWKEIFFCV